MASVTPIGLAMHPVQVICLAPPGMQLQTAKVSLAKLFELLQPLGMVGSVLFYPLQFSSRSPGQ